MRPRIEALLAVCAAGWLLAAPPAQADPLGGLVITPGESLDVASMRMRTTAGCPADADAYNATMRGHGLPPNGQIITATTDAGMSHTAAFEAFPAETLRDFAADNNTTFTGDYQVTVSCVDSFAQQSKGDFTATLRVPVPGRYVAVGAAKGPDRVADTQVPAAGALVAPGTPGTPGAPQTGPASGAPEAVPYTPPNASTSDSPSALAPQAAANTHSSSPWHGWFQPFAFVFGLALAVSAVVITVAVVRRRRREG